MGKHVDRVESRSKRRLPPPSAGGETIIPLDQAKRAEQLSAIIKHEVEPSAFPLPDAPYVIKCRDGSDADNVSKILNKAMETPNFCRVEAMDASVVNSNCPRDVHIPNRNLTDTALDKIKECYRIAMLLVEQEERNNLQRSGRPPRGGARSANGQFMFKF